MAYPMSRAVPGAESVPLPTSPVVWAGYASRALRASLGSTLLWALAVTMLGFFSPLRMGRVVDDVARLVPAVLFVIFVVGAVSLGREIGRAFKYVLGYGRLKRTSEFHGHTVVPRRGLRLKRGATLLGVLLGMVAAGIMRAAVQDWVMALLLGGLAMWAALGQPLARPGAVQLGQLAGCMVVGVGGYALLVAATRIGEASAIAPYRYSRLVFALILAFLVFDERPDLPTLLGAGLIVASGCYTMWREAALRRRRLREAGFASPC